MSTTNCIRLRKNNLCRLDLKPCKGNCSLRKTKEEQRLYLEEVEQNKISWEAEWEYEAGWGDGFDQYMIHRFEIFE